MFRRVTRLVGTSSAARGGIFFIAASVAVNLSNFVFHLALSRLLGPSGYGALGALLNVTAVLTVPLTAVQVVVAQSVARQADPAATPPLGRLLRLAAIAAVIGVVVWLAATPTIDRFFHLRSPEATIALGFWFIPVLPSAVLEGVLVGQQRFRVVGIGQLVGGGLARLATGALLVGMGMGVLGGVVATVAATVVTLAIYVHALRAALHGRGRFVLRAGEAALSTMALGGAALLTSIDAWLARHFMAAHPAGLFAAAATAGRIALFLPAAVTLVYFPRLAAAGGTGPAARQALARATGLVALIGLATAGAMALVPSMVATTLFGAGFSHASVAIGTVALADAGIGIAICLIYFQVARRSRLSLAAWPACGAALGLAAAFHGSIEVLALDMVGASWALVVGIGVPTARTALRSLADDRSSLPRQTILAGAAEVDVTLVVPFYNVGADRLGTHLARLGATLAETGITFEVVAVSDGSTDGSEAALGDLPAEWARQIVWSDNRGKGEALRIGLAHGRGRYLGFIDGDGDIPAAVLPMFVDIARRERPEVVVGSKRHRDAQVQYPPLRRLYSVGYQALTSVLFGLRVRDTQTGVKLIRRDVVAEVLPRMVEKRFAFDLELLAVAHRLGFRQVVEVPVTIGERFPSTISPNAVWRMLQDTLATFWRLRVLRFYDAPLDAGRSARGAVVSLAVQPAAGDLATSLRDGEKLRILVLSWRDLAHPRAGGAEVYTHRVARTWVAEGHQVTWFAAAVAGQPSADVVDGITVIRRGGRHSVYRQARRFYERQGMGHFDLVVDQVNTRPFEAVRWAGPAPVVALIFQLAREVWFHELAWPFALLGRFLLEPRWLRRLRAVPALTISESTVRSLRRVGIEDVANVPVGIDAVEVPGVERELVPTIAFVGRLARNKRPDHAIRAFELLRRRCPDARLWMIGTGPMASELARHAPRGVEFLGRLPEREKHHRLARAHCLIATSVREGWGLTVTEAAQVGTPAVAYDVDGLRDSVPASGGILVAPRPEALADALVERLPSWAADGPPPVAAGGVLPWAAVAMQLLQCAADRVDARERTRIAGEDVAVAWRRALGPLAALCDRRAWSVAGIAALVAVAPLAELGAAAWARALAGVALGCVALAVLGTWADAARWPVTTGGQGATDPLDDEDDALSSPAAHLGPRMAQPSSSPTDRTRPRPLGPAWAHLWAPRVIVGGLAGAVAQTWFAHRSGDAGSLPRIGAAWAHQVAVAFSPGARDAPGALAGVFQLPISAAGSALHLLGASAAVDERVWLTALFACVALAMTWFLQVLGLAPSACAIGGLVYAVSPYVMAMSGPDLAYLSAMTLVPGVAAWVVTQARAERISTRALVWGVPGALLLGLACASPPLVVICFVAIAGSVLLVGWLGGRDQLWAAFRRSAAGVVALVVTSAYWAIPFGLQLGSTSMISTAAHRHWGWAGSRATLANSLWLNTAWDWKDRTRFPYAGDYLHFPLVLWRYALPVAAFTVFGVAGMRARTRLNQRRLRVMTAAGVVALLTVTLATGDGLPGRPIFALVTALPYGWLVEDPGRFLFVAGAAYAVLVAILVDLHVPRSAPMFRRDARQAVALTRAALRPVGVAAIGLLLLAPAFPLVSGEMHLVGTSRASAPRHVREERTAVQAIGPAPRSGTETSTRGGDLARSST